MRRFALAVAAVVLLVAASAALAAGHARYDDGGSASYTGTGPSYPFVLMNSGSTTWKYFYLVAPAGSTFAGGEITGGGVAPCSVGQPDGSAGEIECGPFSSGGGPGTQVLFTGTLSAPVACGAPFQLFVNSTGSPPYTALGAAGFGGSCGTAPPPSANCDNERAAVAVAQAKVDALAQKVADITDRWLKARTELSAATDELDSIHIGNAVSGGLVALVGALTEAEDAARSAQDGVNGAEVALVVAGVDLTNARKDLATAEDALAACEGDNGSSAGAGLRYATLTAARPAADCADQQADVAAAKAAVAVFADPRKRTSVPKLTKEERRLRAAIARLARATAAPKARRFAPKIRPALAKLRAADSIMRGGLKGLVALQADAQQAQADLAVAQEALASCQGG